MQFFLCFSVTIVDNTKIFILSHISAQTAAYYYYQRLKKQSERKIDKSFCVRFIIVNIILPPAAVELLAIQFRPFILTDLLRLKVDHGILCLLPIIVWSLFLIFGIINYVSQVTNRDVNDYFASEYIQKSLFLEKFKRYPLISYWVQYLFNLLHFANTLRLLKIKKNNHESARNLSSSNCSLSKLDISTGFYIALIIASIGTVVFLIVRALICTGSFLICYSGYFANLIILLVPFLVYFKVIIQGYLKMKDMIVGITKKSRAKLQRQCDHFLDDLGSRINGSHGKISIYIRVKDINRILASDIEAQILQAANNKVIEVDVPEMLYEIKDDLRRELIVIISTRNLNLQNANYKITVDYQKMPQNSPIISLPSINNESFYSGCNNDLDDFKMHISSHLTDWNIHAFGSRLQSQKVFYDISSVENIDCFGIDKGLYDYICNVVTSLNQLFYSTIFQIIIGMYLCFILNFAIFVFARIDSSITYISTLSQAPISLAAIVVIIGYISIPSYDDSKIKKNILEILFKSKRGYFLFCPPSKIIQNDE